MARIAKSLDVLRAQINTKYPQRSKTSDGWLGDAAHAARASDHNPNGAGVVTALDITHDLAHGVDTWKLAEVLRLRKDRRIKYVISNGRIFSSVSSPWVWRPYTGANKHAQHVHVSVLADPKLYDDAAPWALDGAGLANPAPVVAPPKGITADLRRRMAKAIVDFEARRVNGKLAIYHLPANDGGGAYEVAGINVKYHAVQAAKLKALVEAGRYDEAESSVIDYLLNYTKPAAGWTPYAGVEFYLRDCVFNRGPTGAAKILQRSIGAISDGEIGPATRAKMADLSPEQLLSMLRAGREDYERNVVGYRANFWKGLVSRWDKALVKAKEFQKEQGALPLKKTVGVGGGAAVVAFTFWDWIAAHPITSGFIAAGILAVIILCIRQFKAMREAPPDQPIAPVGSTIEGA